MESDAAVLGFELNPAVPLSPMDDPFVVTDPTSTYALGVIEHGVLNEITLYAAPLDAVTSASVPWKKICDVDEQVTTTAVHGSDLYLLTHKDSPRFKVLHTSLSDPDLAHRPDARCSGLGGHHGDRCGAGRGLFAASRRRHRTNPPGFVRR